jgi:thiol-disulfide isomerase/thioredoxin
MKKLVIFGKKNCTKCDRLREVLPQILETLNLPAERNDIETPEGKKVLDDFNSNGYDIVDTPTILLFDGDKLVGRIEGVSGIDTPEERLEFFILNILSLYAIEKD